MVGGWINMNSPRDSCWREVHRVLGLTSIPNNNIIWESLLEETRRTSVCVFYSAGNFPGPAEGRKEKKERDAMVNTMVELWKGWIEKVEREVENLLIIQSLHGVRGELSMSTVTFLIEYQCRGTLEKVQKFKTALLLCHALRQDEFPDPEPLLDGDHSTLVCGGSLGRAFRDRIIGVSGRAARNRSLRLALDLYHKKTGALPVDDRFIQQSLQKHWKILTTPVPLRDGAEERLEDALEATVRQTVREVCRPTGRKLNPTPSYGASFQCPRKHGGAFGQIIDNSLSRMRYLLDPQISYLVGYVSTRGVVEELRTPVSPDLDRDIKDEYEGNLDRLAELGTPIPCVPVPLCEPYKVRVITRGEANAYQLCRQWQRRIASDLGRHPTFRLTRGPLDRGPLEELLNKARGRKDILWVSGDYSSATDLLLSSLSEACLSEICRVYRVPAREEAIMMKCLTGHLLVNQYLHSVEQYDAKTGITEDNSSLQENGQLMGSPISFPILCLVNAAVTRFALESYPLGNYPEPREFKPLWQCPMLVNGDDILFPVEDRGHYLWWKTCARTAGLEFSIGKNYISSEHVVLNSEVWQIGKRIDFFGDVTWVLGSQVKHLNLGLLWGETKSKAAWGVEASLFEQGKSKVGVCAPALAARARAFIDGVRGERADQALQLWIHLNSGLLKLIPGEVGYFIPPQLGGLGLPATREGIWEGTERKRKLAAFLASRPDPEAQDILVPLGSGTVLPGWVEQARGELRRACDTLDVNYEWSEDRTEDLSLRFQRFYMSLGTGPLDENRGEALKRFQKRLKKIWRRAMATSLSPMSPAKILSWRTRRVISSTPLSLTI